MAEPTQNPEVDVLRRALESAQANTASLAERANRAETVARSEQVGRIAAQEQAIDSAIAQAEATERSAKSRWTTLQAEGNFEGAADAMSEMGRAQAALAQLQRDKATVAGQRQQIERQPAAPAATDELAGYSPQEREWINRNPRFLTDPQFKAQVHAAAMAAEHLKHTGRNTPAFFEHIEREVYPERFQQQTREQSNVDAGGNQIEEPGIAIEPQSETQIEASPGITLEPTGPSMRVDEKPAEPQQRAIGRGGDGIRGVAAPSRRAIGQASARAAQNNTIHATQEELQTARALYDTIETDPSAARDDETVIRWYHAMYNHPSHRNTKRRNWVFSERGEAA